MEGRGGKTEAGVGGDHDQVIYVKEKNLFPIKGKKLKKNKRFVVSKGLIIDHQGPLLAPILL